MTKTELNENVLGLKMRVDHYKDEVANLQKSLSKYDEELLKLRARYDVDNIQQQIRKNKTMINDTESLIRKLEFKYVAKLLNDSLKPERYDDKFNSKFLNWCRQNHGIKYKADSIKYCTFYKDYIKDETADDLELGISDTYASMYAEYWFRGELDDECELIIPFKVLDNISDFADNIRMYFAEVEQKAREEAERKAKETEEAEYKQYLKLKEKFENKNVN